jgi:hypothetical protein
MREQRKAWFASTCDMPTAWRQELGQIKARRSMVAASLAR